MMSVLKFLPLILASITYGQKDTLVNVEQITTRELSLKNSVIDSLLQLSINKVNASESKNRVQSYSMYIGTKSRYIAIVINSGYIDLSSEKFIGVFKKENYLIYCFDENLYPLFDNIDSTKMIKISYVKLSDADYLIQSNYLDERSTLDGKVTLNGLEYDVHVESVIH